jgi:hypothetical protein
MAGLAAEVAAGCAGTLVSLALLAALLSLLRSTGAGCALPLCERGSGAQAVTINRLAPSRADILWNFDMCFMSFSPLESVGYF